LTTGLLIYGAVRFSESENNEVTKKGGVDFLNSKGWSRFTSGFIIGGFGGASIAYNVLEFMNGIL
jgi:hypothetical protein